MLKLITKCLPSLHTLQTLISYENIRTELGLCVQVSKLYVQCVNMKSPGAVEIGINEWFSYFAGKRGLKANIIATLNERNTRLRWIRSFKSRMKINFAARTEFRSRLSFKYRVFLSYVDLRRYCFHLNRHLLLSFLHSSL